jgi:hypothetical protein
MRTSTFLKIAQIALGICLSAPVSAQTTRTYIVTNEGDTVRTAVRFSQKLADNNREVFAFVGNRTVRYAPGDIKAYYNGLQEYETQFLGEATVFLQRHTAGYASLYYCDETILAEMIRNYTRLGDQLGYSLKDAVGSALKSVKDGVYFGGKIPVLMTEGKNLRIFDPNLPKRKQELAAYFYDYPGIESVLSQEKMTPETYEQLVMAYNQWKPQAVARLVEQEKTATGF